MKLLSETKQQWMSAGYVYILGALLLVKGVFKCCYTYRRGLLRCSFRQQWANGYFSSDAEMNKEASHIVELNPDFLIVGMGALMQEKFLLKVKKMGYQGIGFTCGGFVHQTAMNRMHYYPNWVDKMNLRFVYRMYKEKHTRTRYLQAAFLFPVRFIGERIFG